MGRTVLMSGSLVALILPAIVGAGQAPPTRSPPASAPAGAGDYVFRASTGLLIFHVKPESASEFESVIVRIEQGLDAATDAVRRQQRAASRLFRSMDAPAGTALYVLLADPVVAGADYDPVRMITELLPGESQALYDRLRSAVVKVERMSLAPLR